MSAARRPLPLVTLALLCATAAVAQTPAGLRGTIPGPERAWPRLETPAMDLRLGRRSGTPACGIDCAEFIIAEGDIRTDSAEHLMRLMMRLRRPLPVYLHSPGGSLEGGLALGRALRHWKLPVLVGQRNALPCLPAAGCTAEDERAGITVYSEVRLPATCNSACVYTFAGGTTRGLLPGSTLGIHQFYIARSNDPARTPNTQYSKDDFSHLQRTVSLVAAYLSAMGVSTDVLAMAAEVDAGAIRRLTKREAHDLGLTTGETPPAYAARVVAPPPVTPAPAPVGPARTAFVAPPRATGDWPMVERGGKPFIVLTAPATSRRFGEIANEIAIGCPAIPGRYTASFREIVPQRPESQQDAEVIVGAIGHAERLTPDRGISRETALAAARTGTLEIEVTSRATAGHPMRMELPGAGLQQALETLDLSCGKP